MRFMSEQELSAAVAADEPLAEENPSRPPDITVYPEPIHLGSELASPNVAPPAPPVEAIVQITAVPPAPGAETLALAQLGGRRLAEVRQLGALVDKVGPIIGELALLLKGIDTGKLHSLLAVFNDLASVGSAIDSPEGIKQRVAYALRILRVWSTITPSDADDELIGRIDHLLCDPGTGAAALEAVCQIVAVLLVGP
ncbi:MAG TPA: hypothetical protein VG125_22025, partial [Pirellulales bacterium]|nr:hypothetical protein [Pirellulales bacterium]